MEPYGFIYITTNNINNKKYIGKRKIRGNQEDAKYLGSGKLLLRAVQKYGENNFTREILDYAYTKQELSEKERHYIEKYNATQSSEFYNIHLGGDGGNTMHGWSEKEKQCFKERMSQVTSGSNNGMFGRKHSLESCEKMSSTKRAIFKTERYREIFQSQEFRDRMSRIASGSNNGMFGRKHSLESKLKMSQSKIGKGVGVANGNFGNVGELAKNGKPVYGYLDKEHTQLAKSYNTVRLFLQDHNLKGHVGLIKAIEKNEKYKGYYWSRQRTCND